MIYKENKKRIFSLLVKFIIAYIIFQILYYLYFIYLFYKAEKIHTLLFWLISFIVNTFYLLVNLNKGFKTIINIIYEVIFYNSLLALLLLLFYRFFELEWLLKYSGPLDMLQAYYFSMKQTLFAGNWLLPIIMKLSQIIRHLGKFSKIDLHGVSKT
jgi:hypothetical protein